MTTQPFSHTICRQSTLDKTPYATGKEQHHITELDWNLACIYLWSFLFNLLDTSQTLFDSTPAVDSVTCKTWHARTDDVFYKHGLMLPNVLWKLSKFVKMSSRVKCLSHFLRVGVTFLKFRRAQIGTHKAVNTSQNLPTGTVTCVLTHPLTWILVHNYLNFVLSSILEG